MMRYKGREISKAKANLLCIGYGLAIVGGAVGTWICAVLFVGLLG